MALRRSEAASSGGTMLNITPVPISNPATVTSFGARWMCQWNGPLWWWGAVCTIRLKATSSCSRLRATTESRIARPDPAEFAGPRVLQVHLVGTRDDEQLVGGARPERAHHDALVVGEDHAGPVDEFGLDGGAQDAAAGESGERPFLVEDLARDEGHAEQLGVRVGERRTGFPTVVHDGLGVPDVGLGRVLHEPLAQQVHHGGDLVVVERSDVGVVIARVHEQLVDPTRLGLNVHRPEVPHGQRFVAVERRIPVRHDAGVGVELLGRRDRRDRLGAAGAERTRATGATFHGGRARGEVGRPIGPGRHDGHPTAGQGIQA